MTPNRLIFAGSVVLFLIIASWNGHPAATVMLKRTYPYFATYFIFAGVIFVHILYKPGISPARRLIAMVADFVMISLAAAEGGLAAGLFYPFYLWTIFGNGFRFGIPFLYASMLVGNICFVAVLDVTGVWHKFVGLSIALSLCLIMIPLYAGTLIRKLSEAKEQAEQASRAKSSFLASVSHELRTPLTAIIGLGNLLRNQIRDPEQKGMIETISKSGDTLLRLINAILDFSRLEAGRMPSSATEVDFYREMWRIEKMLAVSAAAKSLDFLFHISARTPRRLITDFSHLEQVLVNLCTNAIKFTDKGRVVVTVSPVCRDENRVWLRFEVTDTGIGIAADVQQKVFESFSQADPTILDRFGGTGLGLAICKQLVQLLNGEIGLISELGKGSTFWFEVGVTEAPEGCQNSKPLNGARALLLSGDQHIRTTASAALGADIIVATNANEFFSAVSRIKDKQVLAVIDMRGIAEDDIAAIRLELKGRSVGIAVVEREDLQTIEQLQRQGFEYLISVPITALDLKQALELVKVKMDAILDGEDTVPSIPRASQRLSVLLAEDNPTNQMVISKVLEYAGHRVTVVNNGQEALERLEKDQFDLVLMDLNMPVLNGLDATKLYRFASVGEPHIPIVGLTADASSDAWARCIEAGMDAYATKPIEPTRLIETLDALAGERVSTPASKVVKLAGRSPSTVPLDHPIDKEKLRDLKEIGGEPFVAELLRQFCSDAYDLLSRLIAAVDREDAHEFHEAAHALRGCAGNVGAKRIFDACLATHSISPERLASDGREWIVQLTKKIDEATAGFAELSRH